MGPAVAAVAWPLRDDQSRGRVRRRACARAGTEKRTSAAGSFRCHFCYVVLCFCLLHPFRTLYALLHFLAASEYLPSSRLLCLLNWWSISAKSDVVATASEACEEPDQVQRAHQASQSKPPWALGTLCLCLMIPMPPIKTLCPHNLVCVFCSA